MMATAVAMMASMMARMANVYIAVFDVFEKRSFWNVLPTQNVLRILKCTPLPPIEMNDSNDMRC